jgi:hypothetical protein
MWPEVSAADALLWSSRGLGLAALQQSTEALYLRRHFSNLQVWRVDGPRALQIDSYRLQTSVHLARCVAGGILMYGGPSLALPILVVLTVLGLAPMRGSFNGGSDNMTLMLGAGLSVSFLGHGNVTTFLGGLYFVATHALLSYFVAGLAKLKEPSWRNGSALRQIGTWARYQSSRPRSWVVMPRTLSVMVVAYECSAPAVFAGPGFGWLYCVAGFGFHIANAFALGLHRFWPVWIATYPAVLYVSSST